MVPAKLQLFQKKLNTNAGNQVYINSFITMIESIVITLYFMMFSRINKIKNTDTRIKLIHNIRIIEYIF